eukprot:15336620-Ditylum_brightwellii.AAC.1
MNGNGNEPNTGSNKSKQQGGSLLLFLDHDFKAYYTTEWYQWELNVQMLVKGATQLNTANDIGTKIKSLLIKLLAVHDKDNINIFAKTRQYLEIENFPKGTKETKDLLVHETTNGRYKSVLMILHITGLIPFRTFKNKIFNWLKMNNIYLNIMIFRNTKETVTKIGHITKINPTRFYHAACQEQLNEALAVVASEVDKEDKTYFKNYGTSWESANFKVQLRPEKPSIIIIPNQVETSALAVYELQSHVRTSQELMLRVAPM